jgi:uncharacterized membrane protein
MASPIPESDKSSVPTAAPTTRRRVASVDVLRGLVMVLMAVDHTRDFIHAGAMAFRPEDLTQTTAAIFFTRWITHFCAPAFMFSAGLGAWFRLDRGGNSAALSRFLWTRGLWLIVLEFTVVRLGFFFNFDYSVLILLVFWALGACMIALALLVRLPYRVVLAVSLAMIVLHNLADPVAAARFGAFAWAWQILHQQSVITTGGPAVVVAYPLVPWIGVMAAGFCFGRLYRLPDDRRGAALVRLGVALTLGFVVLRAMNVYGDPSPWTAQSRPGFTLLSFLNCTKYPPSLAFLLMTLGPAIAFLGWIDRTRPSDRNPLLVFGRVPLFYFVLHIPLIHAVAIGLTWLRHGAAPFLFVPPPTLGTPRTVFPPDYGWHLWQVYAVTAAVVAALYRVCLWYARLKARRRDWWWLSYL